MRKALSYLHKSTMPRLVKIKENIKVLFTFFSKKIPIISATITGYVNKIVQAIPASISLNPSNKSREESENKIPRKITAKLPLFNFKRSFLYKF